MRDNTILHRLIGAAIPLLVVAPSALSWCYILRRPQPGYIPGLQAAPCNQCQCSVFDICPPGKECERVFGNFGARDDCNRATIVVPMERWLGGQCNSGQNGCCHVVQGVSMGPMTSPNNCTIPNDSIGGGYCLIVIE